MFHQFLNLNNEIDADTEDSNSSFTYTEGCNVPSEVQSLSFLPSTQRISTEAFKGCRNIRSIHTLPPSITHIGNCAFQHCYYLTSVTLPDSITDLGDQAFANCSSLRSIVLPPSLTKLSNKTFFDCCGLTSVHLPSSRSSLPSSSFAVIERAAFKNCSSLTAVHHLAESESITAIGEQAFRGCTALTSVHLPSSLANGSMGHSVFQNCHGLVSVHLPDSIVRIPETTFFNCDSLTDVRVSPNVAEIEIAAFLRCRELVTVPCLQDTADSPLARICTEAFFECSSLFLPRDSIAEGGRGEGVMHLPSNLVHIGDRAFYGCLGLKGTLRLPSSLKTIGRMAFGHCMGITKVEMGDGVERVAVDSFDGCASLESVVIRGMSKLVGAVGTLRENGDDGNHNGTAVATTGGTGSEGGELITMDYAHHLWIEALEGPNSTFDRSTLDAALQRPPLSGTTPSFAIENDRDNDNEEEEEEERIYYHNWRNPKDVYYYNWRNPTRIRDDHGRLPLHVAAEQNLRWAAPMEEGRRVGRMEKVLVSYLAAIEETDVCTGMPAFMLAAVGGGSNLEAVYRLLLEYPNAIVVGDGCVGCTRER